MWRIPRCPQRDRHCSAADLAQPPVAPGLCTRLPAPYPRRPRCRPSENRGTAPGPGELPPASPPLPPGRSRVAPSRSIARRRSTDRGRRRGPRGCETTSPEPGNRPQSRTDALRRLTGRLRAGCPPRLRGLQGGKSGHCRSGTAGPPPSSPGRRLRSDLPARSPRFSPGRAALPVPRPAAAAGRLRAAASPPRPRLSATVSAPSPPTCQPAPSPPGHGSASRSAAPISPPLSRSAPARLGPRPGPLRPRGGAGARPRGTRELPRPRSGGAAPLPAAGARERSRPKPRFCPAPTFSGTRKTGVRGVAGAGPEESSPVAAERLRSVGRGRPGRRG